MRSAAFLVAPLLLAIASAHGDHDVDLSQDPDITYAELHMAQEHHFDSFDLGAFFHLHDLNRDGVLDVNELESIYGVHHEKLKKSTGNVEVHTAQAKAIVNTVLEKLDTNGDGVLTMREFVAGGVAGLPNFKNVEHLGHHYDAEGEYFLHHEEKFHNTPETQNEEDYIHPEDIEHFMQHEKIEEEEEERVREFMGEEPTLDEEGPATPAAGNTEQQVLGDVVDTAQQPVVAAEGAGSTDPKQGVPSQRVSSEEQARQERAAFAKAQAAKFGKASFDASQRGEWGKGKDGMKRPKDVADRLRRGVPYKYRVKKSFWEF